MTDYLYRFLSGVSDYYRSMNAAYLSGAIDVLVVEQEDGSFKSSPFHVRFGKSASFLHNNRHVYVDVYVNDVLTDLKMKLGPAGEAFFVEEVEGNVNDAETLPPSLFTSPIQSDDEDEEGAPKISLVTLSDFPPDKKLQPPASGSLQRQRALSWPNLADIQDTQMQVEEVIKNMSLETAEQIIKEGESESTGNMSSPISEASQDLLLKLAAMGSPNLQDPYSRQTSLRTSLSNPDLSSVGQEMLDVEWQWGQFPRTKSRDESKAEHSEKETSESTATTISTNGNNNIIENGRMPKSKISESSKEGKEESKGVYLDDLDPELSNLYLYHSGVKKTGSQDLGIATTSSERERNTGSPLSDDHGYKSDSEIACGNCGSASPRSRGLNPPIQNVSLSLCGGLKNDGKISWERFVNHMVTFEDYNKDPDGIINHPDLVICLNDAYYNWKTAGPMILSVLAFQAALPQKSIDQLQRKHMYKAGSSTRKKRSWFLWKTHSADSEESSKPSTDISVGSTEVAVVKETSSSANSVNVESGAASPKDSPHSSDTIVVNADSTSLVEGSFFLKSVRLTSDEIKSLNLKPGTNKIVFSITTSFQGTTQCVAYVYRVKWHDKFVISDIDGTITRSDVLGHILPMIGRCWTHQGVAKLFSKIRKNGYHILYLSSRGIGMAGVTRQFLEWVKEDGILLPDGPIMLNPTSLVTAFRNEVIEKCPEKFKIACLSDLKNLFPQNPFYAGFGNRDNDSMAYETVGIDHSKIFIINRQSEIHPRHSFVHRTSYLDLYGNVDLYFPSLDLTVDVVNPSVFHHIDYKEFTDFSYWSTSFPVDVDVLNVVDETEGAKGASAIPA